MQACVRNFFVVAFLSATVVIEAALPEVFWGEATEAFELGLSFEKVEFRHGEPIIATVIIRNFSGRDRLIPAFVQPDLNYEFIITRDRGEGIPKVEQMRMGSYLGGIPIGANVSETNQIRLDQKFDFARPGTYVVTASRQVAPSSREGEITLASEKISLRSGNALIRITEVAGSDSVHNASIPPSAPRVQNSANAQIKNLPRESATTPKVNSSSETPLPPAGTSPSILLARFTSVQKIGGGIIACLIVLLLAILWRASRRKRI